MTYDILKRAAEAVALMTKGRPVQFHPYYCPEAKGARLNEWDSSHDLSVIFDDGSRYRIGTFRHADDAAFDQLARTLIPDMAAAIAERDAEIARLTARAEAAEAETKAGAVMVEAALRLPAYDSDGDPAGQFDHHVFVRRDDLRALSTLSPIAAAAGVLIPVFEEKHRDYMTSKGRDPDHYSSSYSMAVQDLRALAEQEKAE